MATSTLIPNSSREAKAVSVPAPAIPQVQVDAPSRREFLYYIWGASLALLLGEVGAAVIWFALPRFKEGTFGGIFSFPPEQVPEVEKAPYNQADGRFWVSNPSDGFIVLYGVCPHLGCLPKYQLDGKFIEGPAPRSMDRFLTTLTFEDGTTLMMDAAGDPMPLDGKPKITNIKIDTGKRIMRPGRV